VCSAPTGTPPKIRRAQSVHDFIAKIAAHRELSWNPLKRFPIPIQHKLAQHLATLDVELAALVEHAPAVE
jgi:hypothetical protein